MISMEVVEKIILMDLAGPVGTVALGTLPITTFIIHEQNIRDSENRKTCCIPTLENRAEVFMFDNTSFLEAGRCNK
jgi:hypothetical protein